MHMLKKTVPDDHSCNMEHFQLTAHSTFNTSFWIRSSQIITWLEKIIEDT